MPPSNDTPTPETHPAALEIETLLRGCDVRRSRAGGPGGQHRNKVETAVTVVHRSTGIRGAASERRSQEANRRAAVFRLRVNLALSCRVPREPPCVPSPRWRQRCQRGALRINARHDDFPALLAEALDVIAAVAFAVPDAARALGCSTSQLVKLLRAEPAALSWVNAQRAAEDLPPLR